MHPTKGGKKNFMHIKLKQKVNIQCSRLPCSNNQIIKVNYINVVLYRNQSTHSPQILSNQSLPQDKMQNKPSKQI